MRGLYALVDVETLDRRRLDPVRFAEAVLAAKPAALQLRDKASGARRTLELLRQIQPLAARAGVPFFANDRADLARIAGVSGVHVGQEDVPVPLVRSTFPGMGVGLSTHDEAQVEEAIDLQPDYIAIGPIFPTASKERPSPVVGLPRLASLASRVRRGREGALVVAIGGITLDTAAAVAAHADAIAIIGALAPEPGSHAPYAEVEARARALQERIVATARGAT